MPTSFHDFSSIRVGCEGQGKAVSLGSLSVPPSWVAAAPRIGAVSRLPSAGAVDAAQASPVDRPRWHTFQEGLMGMVGGCCASGDADDEKPALGS
ncbi:PE/PPE C-terminal domain-containing protein [Mycobacterium sp. Aquia_216]|uniref:PE/PPE C-terminal domain-containing protein n=1 Tax=Mycobacterium sp. Aquia_216 TaxID=2991729 RepID=UPI003FA375B3